MSEFRMKMNQVSHPRLTSTNPRFYCYSNVSISLQIGFLFSFSFCEKFEVSPIMQLINGHLPINQNLVFFCVLRLKCENKNALFLYTCFLTTRSLVMSLRSPQSVTCGHEQFTKPRPLHYCCYTCQSFLSPLIFLLYGTNINGALL